MILFNALSPSQSKGRGRWEFLPINGEGGLIFLSYIICTYPQVLPFSVYCGSAAVLHMKDE